MNPIKHFVSNIAQWKGKLGVSRLKGCIITRNRAHSFQGGSAVQQLQYCKVLGRNTGNIGSPLEISLEDVYLDFWPTDTLWALCGFAELASDFKGELNDCQWPTQALTGGFIKLLLELPVRCLCSLLSKSQLKQINKKRKLLIMKKIKSVLHYGTFTLYFNWFWTLNVWFYNCW